MSDKTHWQQSPNKNYLGHWDLPESGEMVVTIKSAQWEVVTNPITNQADSKRVIRFKENIKPMICNQTNAQAIVKSSGVKFMEDSEGVAVCLTIGSTKVMGEQVECIRIKPAPLYNLDSLRALFIEVEENIDPSQIEPIEKALQSGEKAELGKVFKYLNKLKK